MPQEMTQLLAKGEVFHSWLYGFYLGAMGSNISVEPDDLPEHFCRLGQLGILVDREDVMERLVQVYNECRGKYGFQDKQPLVASENPSDADFKAITAEIRHMMDTAL